MKKLVSLILALAMLLSCGMGDAMSKIFTESGVAALEGQFLFYTFAMAMGLALSALSQYVARLPAMPRSGFLSGEGTRKLLYRIGRMAEVKGKKQCRHRKHRPEERTGAGHVCVRDLGVFTKS